MPDSATLDIRIPPMPDALVAIQRETAAAEPDFPRIVDIIAGDVGLAAELLKTVNSPAVGLGQAVTSIPHAASLLGVGYVLNLATGFYLRSAVGESCGLALNRFWDTAADVALASATLARAVPGAAPDLAYTLGLLHDCGIPLLMCRFEDYGRVLSAAEHQGETVITASERRRFGLDHAAVGYRVATSWHLPPVLCEAIRRHHDFPRALADARVAEPVLTHMAVLKMAEHVSNRFRGLAFRDRTEDHEWERIKDDVLAYAGVGVDEFEDRASDLMPVLGGR